VIFTTTVGAFPPGSDATICACGSGKKYQRCCPDEVAELFAGAEPNISLFDPMALKKSAKEMTAKQDELFSHQGLVRFLRVSGRQVVGAQFGAQLVRATPNNAALRPSATLCL
jgi:hypothetical protein